MSETVRPAPIQGSHSVPCPACGHSMSTTRDSRLAGGGNYTRRRRACCRCNFRFTTHEVLAGTEHDHPLPAKVIVKDLLTSMLKLMET